MKKILFFLLLTLFVVTGAAAFYFSSGNSSVSSPPGYQLMSKSCWFKVDWRKKVKCFHLKTSQEHGEFLLPVVVIVDESEDRRSDPVLYLQGGPGAGAGLNQAGIDRWLNWVELAGLKRDLILMDQRGTGESLPKLNCNDKGEQIRSWKRNDSLLDELQANNQAMLNCFDELVQKNPALNVQNFSTTISAEDILQLMQQLNHREWNLLGVSYGTRLALEIEGQQGQARGLKSLVLDSVYPAEAGGVQTWPDVLGEALDRFFTGCVSQAECKTILGEQSPQILFTESLEKLKTIPVRLSIRRWDGEAPLDFIVNDHRFLSAVFAATYDPQGWNTIAAAINAIHQQQAYQAEVELKKLMEPYLNRNINSDFNALAFTAVDCADNALGLEEDYQQRVAKHPLIAEYTKGQWQYQLCHQLNNAKPLQWTNPELPVLLLSGRHDPVTPVSWADNVKNNSRAAQWIVRDDLAHSVLSTDVCLLQHLYRFFDEPEKEFNFCKQD